VHSAPVSLRRHYPDQVIWGMFSASIASTPNLGLSKIGRHNIGINLQNELD
jgi:hypothetical protein